MKKLIIAITIMLFSFNAYCQMNITTYLTRTANFNEYTKDYDEIGSTEEITFFSINKSFTLITHTTNNMTSSYRVEDYKKDENDGIWQLRIISDVGNRYIFILDPSGQNVRFVGVKNGQTFLVQYEIKRVWFDE